MKEPKLNNGIACNGVGEPELGSASYRDTVTGASPVSAVPEIVTIVEVVITSVVPVKSPSPPAVCCCLNNPVVTKSVLSWIFTALIAAVLSTVVETDGMVNVVSYNPLEGITPLVDAKAPEVSQPAGVTETTAKLNCVPSTPLTFKFNVPPLSFKNQC